MSGYASLFFIFMRIWRNICLRHLCNPALSFGPMQYFPLFYFGNESSFSSRSSFLFSALSQAHTQTMNGEVTQHYRHNDASIHQRTIQLSIFSTPEIYPACPYSPIKHLSTHIPHHLSNEVL